MKANNAFTFIEIMLAVIIIGIIVALASPNFSKGYSRFELNKSTDDLLSVSRWAQAMAIGQERIYALSFSADRRFYNLVRAKASGQDEGTANTEDADGQISFEPVRGSLGRMHMIPSAIHLVMRQSYGFNRTGDTDLIQFYPDGTIDPATIQLNSLEQKTVLSSTEVRGMMTKVNDE